MNIYKIAMISEELNKLLREKELMQELIEEKGDKLSQQEIDNILLKLTYIKSRMALRPNRGKSESRFAKRMAPRLVMEYSPSS